MAIDTYLLLDGVKGEAKNKDFKDHIDVQSWTWNVSNASATTGGGSGKGKAEPGDFVFTHFYDAASPEIGKRCANGSHFATVELKAQKTGGDKPLDFLVVKLKEAKITSVSPGAAGNGDIVEQVSMSYKDIEFNYKAQDDKGAGGGAVTFGWSPETGEFR